MASVQKLFDRDRVVASNIEFYQSIKPTIGGDSYTVIGTLNDVDTGELVALATGTQAGLKRYENDIEDCHAESLLKRAYKRYVLDRILPALDGVAESTVAKTRIAQVITEINRQELAIFISQFPCGLISRFQGQEPVDEKTGARIVRKPGRGQMINGKVLYVQRDNCLSKMKRWISDVGLQGKSMKEQLGVCAKLTQVLIGDCEPDMGLDYNFQIMSLREELSRDNVDIQLVRMRRSEFTFDSNEKQPLPVSTIWWASRSKANNLEYLVDGRRRGLTKKQCLMQNDSMKLRSSDFWLREDLKRICEVT